ncbi:hypothetical protein BaRGS_00012822 [Batillaria attramentaria]|uniref:Uncharacterized protein n=1 Tax=Batillaria attramentaria TaxID=370345 RepID=A0ABD0L8Z1_9CAEN
MAAIPTLPTTSSAPATVSLGYCRYNHVSPRHSNSSPRSASSHSSGVGREAAATPSVRFGGSSGGCCSSGSNRASTAGGS